MNSHALAMNIHPVERILDGWVHAFGDYYPRRNAAEHMNSPWSKAVILAKRKHETIIARFSEIIAAHLIDTLTPGNSYIITPVPGTPDRQRHLFRSLDRPATELLADCIRRKLAAGVTIKMTNLLIQIRTKKKSQHQCLSTAERVENVRDLYAVRNGISLAGKGVILVDDIITSGATMAACAQALRKAGAAEVIGVALARTVRISQANDLTADMFA